MNIINKQTKHIYSSADISQQIYHRKMTSQPSHRKPKGHPNQDSQLKSLRIIEAEVQKRMVNPEESSYCHCQICKNKYQIREKGRVLWRENSSSLKIQSIKIQEFLGLLCAVDGKVYCRVDIPEICFFYKSTPKRLFKSNNSGVHCTQIPPTLNRQNLINVFVQSRLFIAAKSSNKDSGTSSAMSLGFLANQPKDAHIKNFKTIVPSFKSGQHVDTSKPQTFIFHNNAKYADEPMLVHGRMQSEEICVVKSKDKGLQLINQKQLKQTIKSLVLLKDVQYIQTYVKPNQNEDKIHEASYQRIKGPQNRLMYNRSLIHVKSQINLINKFSKDYIPMQTLQAYQSILKDIPHEYCLYQTYKMIHYMQLVKDVTVQKLGTLWVRNQSEQFCYFGLAAFQWMQNQKLSVDIGEIQELKQIMTSQLTDFQQELLNAWEHMKSRKLKVVEKEEVDIEKQKQFQQIKQESLSRIAKQKQMTSSMKRTRKKSNADKNMLGHIHTHQHTGNNSNSIHSNYSYNGKA